MPRVGPRRHLSEVPDSTRAATDSGTSPDPSSAGAPRTWRLLRSGPGTPAGNLALDEALLRSADPRPVLRLYSWRPAGLSLGWFQPLEAFDAAAIERAGAVIVRRPTGGGAIHHEHELTFAVVATPGADGYPAATVDGYAFVHEIVRAALAGLGAELATDAGTARLSTRPDDARHCFVDLTRFDLLDRDGRKVVGSAQRRRDGRVLHHGSIPLRAPTLTPESGSVSAAAGRDVGWEEVADALEAAFERVLGVGRLCASEVSDAEAETAADLVRSRYATPVRPVRGRPADPAERERPRKP